MKLALIVIFLADPCFASSASSDPAVVVEEAVDIIDSVKGAVMAIVSTGIFLGIVRLIAKYTGNL